MYLSGEDISVEVAPADGPPVLLGVLSLYLTDLGNRTVYIEYMPEVGDRLHQGQVIRLVIDEGAGGRRHVLERGVIDVHSRKCEVCGVIRSVLVVAEIGRR